MTGRSYAHADAPEEIAQFFLSEFHPERFSEDLYGAPHLCRRAGRGGGAGGAGVEDGGGVLK
ncbi:hypothetical protein N234_21585 [Ralstonia pickettii DTP0602]|nr:hypothetical protein N234_21585 [Ralstonia pickettii DTP0602]